MSNFDVQNNVQSILGTSISLVRSHQVTLLGGLLAALVLIIPVIGQLLYLIIIGALVDFFAMNSGYQGRATSGGGHMFSVILPGILAGVAILIGFAFLIVPGIYFAIQFSLFIPAAVLGSSGPVRPLKESWKRVTGNVPTVLVVNGLLTLPILAAMLVMITLNIDPLIAVAVGLLILPPLITMQSATLFAMYAAFAPLADSQQSVDWQDG